MAKDGISKEIARKQDRTERINQERRLKTILETISTIKEELEDILGTDSKRKLVLPELIILVVKEEFKVDPTVRIGRKPTEALAIALHATRFLLKNYTSLSYRKIAPMTGASTGNINTYISLVNNSLNKVEDLLDTNLDFKQKLERCTSKLEQLSLGSISIPRNQYKRGQLRGEIEDGRPEFTEGG